MQVIGVLIGAGRSAVVLLGAMLLAFVSSDPTPSAVAVTFSRPATYNLTQDAADSKQLFDGHLASGTMWTSRDAVGWIADQRPIVISADLSKERGVGRVCIHTARGREAGVSFPARMDVFTSSDGKRFGWRGDAVGGEAEEGPYEARWFCTPEVDQAIRFVTLVVRTQGGYFFADEIDLRPMAGEATVNASEEDIPANGIQNFILEKQALMQAASHILAMSQERAGSAAGALAQAGRAAAEAATPAALDQVKAALSRSCPIVPHAATVSTVRVAPYAYAGPFCAEALDGNPALQLAPGWHRAASLWISNGGSEPATVRLTPALSGSAATALKVRLLDVRSVLAAPAELVGDPLVPLTDGQVTIPAGQGRQVWIDIEAMPSAAAGDAVLAVGGAGSAEIAIPVRVIALPQGPVPATTVWGYLSDRPIRARPAEAVRDMLDHGVTNAVLPASEMPWPERAGASVTGDYGRFDSTMSLLGQHRQFLFFLGLNDPSKAVSALDPALFSPAWQQRFVDWVKQWSARLLRSGLGYDRFAMYPIDEPGTPAMRDRLILLSRLIKIADPRIRVYSTLHRPEMLNDELIRAVDIFQLNAAALDPAIIARLKRAGKTIWAYETDGGGKSADPAGFYRAQGWRAFLLGLNGFGFWSYADAGRSGSVWDDFDDVRPDFAVIYDGPSGILSSRRWEAWREGVQDYRLLVAADRAANSAAERQRVRALAAEGARSLGDPSRLEPVIDALMQIAGRKTPLNSAGRSAMTPPSPRAPLSTTSR